MDARDEDWVGRAAVAEYPGREGEAEIRNPVSTDGQQVVVGNVLKKQAQGRQVRGEGLLGYRRRREWMEECFERGTVVRRLTGR